MCPVHGVLATNPFSATGAAGGALLGAEVGSVVPGLGTAAGAIVGGAIGAFGSSTKSQTSHMVEGVSARPHTHRLNALDWANRALASR